jgi:peptidoglycan hydrolase-like protein with peptidoglycan-binding domain
VDNDVVIVDDSREIVSVVSTGPVQASGDAMEVEGGVVATDLSEAEIREVQTVLIERGLYEGEVDGIFGPSTREALIVFQRREGLQVTGRVDTRTVARMNLSSKITVREDSRSTVGRTREGNRDEGRQRDRDRRQQARDRDNNERQSRDNQRPRDRDRDGMQQRQSRDGERDRNRAQRPQDRDRAQQARDRDGRQQSRDRRDMDSTTGRGGDDQPSSGRAMQNERGASPPTTGQGSRNQQPRTNEPMASGRNERSGASGRSTSGQGGDRPSARMPRDQGAGSTGPSGGPSR